MRARPDRFQTFATLATPNPDAAAKERERAVTRLGVRVHCLSPRYVFYTPVLERYATAAGEQGVRTRDRTGLGLPRPGDIAPIVLSLCGPAASKITGQIIGISGDLNA